MIYVNSFRQKVYLTTIQKKSDDVFARRKIFTKSSFLLLKIKLKYQ
jgi:hypothetical protein